MHTLIDYSNLSESEMLTKALADVQNYYGAERFEKLCTDIRNDYISNGKLSPPNLSSWVMSCGIFAGIEGPPVLAFYNHAFQTTLTMSDFNAARETLQREQEALCDKANEAGDSASSLAQATDSEPRAETSSD